MAAARQTASPRHPAVPIAVALGLGIFADRWSSAPLEVWLAAAALFAGAWAAAFRWGGGTVSATVLLAVVACLGGARHHLYWSTAADDDISAFVGKERRLVRLTGRLADQPEILSPSKSQRSFRAESDATAAVLDCRRIEFAGDEIPVSGRAALRVDGRLLDAEVGDEIEVIGWLMRPQPARNPGAFDAADFLRRQGIRCSIWADHPDAVQRVGPVGSLSLWRLAARVRAAGEAMFNRDLTPRNAPVAAALLLGIRAQMDEDIRDAFTQSGLLHILAISGAHVAILAMLVWFLCRGMGLSVRMTSIVSILAIVGYTLLTDCRPPVIRATVLICLYATARFFNRAPALANCLAWAAIGILIWNPTDLFDVGTQLSFLAVLGIVWANSQKAGLAPNPAASAFLRGRAEWGRIRSAAEVVRRAVGDEFRISLGAALFTLPLVAARFHLVSPIGVVINVVLASVSTIVLWLGYLYAGIGLLVPPFSRLASIPFDAGLSLLLGLVEWAAHVRLSHVYVSGPSNWWLAGYYAILIALAFVEAVRRMGSWAWSMLAAWMLIGLAWGLRSPAPDGLRCTFAAVGHGGAILIECPSGRTLLYDAGSIFDGRQAQRAVQSLLWVRRQPGLDAIILSHADTDHFNGVFGLLKSIPVGGLLVSQQFLDFRQPAVAAVCEWSHDCGVPIRLVRDGDRVALDEGVVIRVLHPPFGRPRSDDNANSVVLSIEYAGRRILLTGDLEGDGQAALLNTAPLDCDVLLAPHHGSRRANSEALAAWARPRHVVVSAGARVDWNHLRAAYRSSKEIISTHEAGAITFEIHPDGALSRSAILPIP